MQARNGLMAGFEDVQGAETCKDPGNPLKSRFLSYSQHNVTYAGYYANSTGNLNRTQQPEEESPEIAPGPRRWIPWSTLLARAWRVDPELCPKCGQQMKKTRPILERKELERLLKSIGRFGYPSRPPPAHLPGPEVHLEAPTSGGQGNATVVQLNFDDQINQCPPGW